MVLCLPRWGTLTATQTEHVLTSTNMSLVATYFFSFLAALRSSEDLLLTISPFLLFKDNIHHWDFLAIQWIRLHAPKAGSLGSILGWGTKIPHTMWHRPKKKQLLIKKQFSLWHVSLTLGLIQQKLLFLYYNLSVFFLCPSKYLARREVGIKKRNILSSLRIPFQSWF